MLTFKQFIQLLEAKIDDIKRMHVKRGHVPEVVDDIINRAKKFGVNISQPLENVKKDVEEREKKQSSKSDVDTIHDDPKTGVSIQRVNTHSACEKRYGEGQAKTKWCVAMGGKPGKDFWNEYSADNKKFYTIHHGDKVYGMHEHENGTIRDADNKEVDPSDIHPDVHKAMAKVPELTRLNIVSGNPYFEPSEEQFSQNVDHALKSSVQSIRKKAVSHPYASTEGLSHVAENDKVRGIRLQARIALEKRQGK